MYLFYINNQSNHLMFAAFSQYQTVSLRWTVIFIEPPGFLKYSIYFPGSLRVNI